MEKESCPFDMILNWANPVKRKCYYGFFPNHESKTSELEKPILALPIHRIDIPQKLKNWHQEVEKVALGG